MGIFAEARGGLDQFSTLCGLSSFNRRGAMRKKTVKRSHFYPTL